jgi:hypothetical protein
LAVLAGIFRDARENRWRPIHFVLPFYGCLIILWNYPHASRFLIPFLPLLAIGIWLEGKRLLIIVGTTMRTSRSTADKVLATAFGLLVAIFVSAVVVNYFGPARIPSVNLSQRRSTLLEEKREAYDWISRFAASDARLVAYEDASLYLYTGRQAARPFTFTSAEFYDPHRLESDLDHMADVARAINADYWITAADDYGFESAGAYREGHARMKVLEQVIPIVFRSRRDHVRIYSLVCLQHPELSGCEQANRVLFPAGHEDPMVGNDLR